MVKEIVVRQYPELDEVFELELDADAPENAPLPGMVNAFGYDPDGWEFTGTPLAGNLKGKFKLVQVGAQPNLDAVEAALEAKYGPTPSGQWMRAFKYVFPIADGKGPIGVADASWVHPDSFGRFPYVNYSGRPYFRWTGHDPYDNWRWLVAVPDESE